MRRIGRFLFGAYVVTPIAVLMLIFYDIPHWIWTKRRPFP